jgi:hypothetical protein
VNVAKTLAHIEGSPAPGGRIEPAGAIVNDAEATMKNARHATAA